MENQNKNENVLKHALAEKPHIEETGKIVFATDLGWCVKACDGDERPECIYECFRLLEVLEENGYDKFGERLNTEDDNSNSGSTLSADGSPKDDIGVDTAGEESSVSTGTTFDGEGEGDNDSVGGFESEHADLSQENTIPTTDAGMVTHSDGDESSDRETETPKDSTILDGELVSTTVSETGGEQTSGGSDSDSTKETDTVPNEPTEVVGGVEPGTFDITNPATYNIDDLEALGLAELKKLGQSINVSGSTKQVLAKRIMEKVGK